MNVSKLLNELECTADGCTTINIFNQPNDNVQRDIKTLLSKGYEIIYFETKIDSDNVSATLRLYF